MLALLFASSQAVKLQSGEETQRHKREFPTAVAEDHLGTSVYDQSMDATTGIANSREHSLGPAFSQRRHKIDPISPENYDPWVYKVSKDNMGNFPQWHFDTNIEQGLGNLHQSRHRHHKKHHRKHQQLHAQELSNKMLQQEIEQLRENYNGLEKKF